MDKRPAVYVDTSIISYLVARTSKNPGVAGRQYETHRWWNEESDGYRLVTSSLVKEEAGRGSPQFAASRLSVLDTLDYLEYVEPETTQIVDELLLNHALPAKARDDATHLAIAVVNGIDYLLTWNLTHLANPKLRPKIEETLRRIGYKPVLICTPWELPYLSKENDDDS